MRDHLHIYNYLLTNYLLDKVSSYITNPLLTPKYVVYKMHVKTLCPLITHALGY